MKDVVIDSDHWLRDLLPLFHKTYSMLKITHGKYVSDYFILHTKLRDMHVHMNVHFNVHYIILKEVETLLRTMIYFWIAKSCVEINLN